MENLRWFLPDPGTFSWHTLGRTMAASCRTGRRREAYFLGSFSDAPQEVQRAVIEATRNHFCFEEKEVLFFVYPGAHVEEGVTVEVCEDSAQLVIVVGKGGSGIVLERVEGGRGHGAQNVSVFLEEDSTFNFISLNTATVPCQLLHHMYVQQGARLHSHLMTLGKASVEHTVESVVEGNGGESSVGWVFFASRNETYALRVTNTFNASRGTGDIAIKGVVEGCARVRCDGMLRIGAGGGGTNTFLSEHILMLDPTARVQAVPALEIHTNDVKASHSATVTRVTEEELFYFSSRGISEEEARPMYIQGFLGSFLERILNERINGCIREALYEKYHSTHQ